MTSLIPFTHIRDLIRTVACVDCERRVELTAAEAEFGGWQPAAKQHPGRHVHWMVCPLCVDVRKIPMMKASQTV